MDLSTYITETSGISLRQIALRAGYQPSKLTRQLNGNNPLTLETLRDIARATGLDMIDLFVRGQLITEREAAKARANGSLRGATDEELAAEVLRRMQAGSATLDQPIDAPLPPEATNVSVFRRRVTAQDVTPEDLMSEAAYEPSDDETPDRDNY